MAIYPSITGSGPATRKNPSPARNVWSTIPLFLLFGWFTLFCTWLIHLARNRPAVEHRPASAAGLYSFVHASSFMPQRLTSTEAAFSGQGMTS